MLARVPAGIEGFQGPAADSFTIPPNVLEHLNVAEGNGKRLPRRPGRHIHRAAEPDRAGLIGRRDWLWELHRRPLLAGQSPSLRIGPLGDIGIAVGGEPRSESLDKLLTTSGISIHILVHAIGGIGHPVQRGKGLTAHPGLSGGISPRCVDDSNGNAQLVAEFSGEVVPDSAEFSTVGRAGLYPLPADLRDGVLLCPPGN